MKHLSIRIDEELLKKYRAVAKHEGRSANRQTLVLIRDCVNKFENEQKQTENK